MELTKRGCDNLREAIVEQACKDYLELKEHLYLLENYRWVLDMSKSREELMNEFTWKLNEIVNFFNSEWYKMLCSINAAWLIRNLDEKFETETKAKIDRKMAKKKGA